MNSLSSSILPFIYFLVLSISWVASGHTHKNFLQCLFSLDSKNSTSISKVIYTRKNSSYSSVLHFSLRNSRFNTTSTPKPLVIVTPVSTSQIQAVITCSHKHGMQIRVRSGGHDYEGLSYISSLPFVIIDMINFRSVTVDVASRTAWVQSGATLGQLYYGIAQKSRTLAFPAGVCPTVGIGGHFSGGGYGMMMRKHGIAADHIVDAQLIDIKGRILDRKSMGEDLFWAIRGGGGNTFGIIVAWKINLVEVPPIVTACDVTRTSEQNITNIVHHWQYAIDKFDEDLFMRIFISRVNSSDHKGNTTIATTFASLFLDRVDRLVPLMQETFPELGLVKEDCIEMSWIDSVLHFSSLPRNSSLRVLLDRNALPNLLYFKGKTDYVREPMPENALEEIWKRLYELPAQKAQLQFTSYGGKMNEISESSVPFPHRAGNIFKIHYAAIWSEQDIEANQKYINWTRRIYNSMTSYVSKNPRAAYVNYRDLDLGVNNPRKTSYKQAKIWGTKYFNKNFDRLVQVKTAVDPTNFFRNEQSIPPLSS